MAGPLSKHRTAAVPSPARPSNRKPCIASAGPFKLPPSPRQRKMASRKVPELVEVFEGGKKDEGFRRSTVMKNTRSQDISQLTFDGSIYSSGSTSDLRPNSAMTPPSDMMLTLRDTPSGGRDHHPCSWQQRLQRFSLHRTTVSARHHASGWPPELETASHTASQP